MDTRVSHSVTPLPELALLSCTGDEARAFLQAQLTNDVEGLAADRVRRAGWCSAQGRLRATFLVVPHADGFLLQLARDIAPAVLKRLSMFVLRARVKLADVSDAWAQVGLWGNGAEPQLERLGLPVPQDLLETARTGDTLVIRVAADRFLLLAPASQGDLAGSLGTGAQDASWELEEIRAGLPQVVQATQEQFIPQMVNLERLGAVDFKKGCYPGQEIVARTQYRGVLKRRMVRARTASLAAAGDELFGADLPGQACGVVANAAALEGGGSELLAVVQISSLEDGLPLRLRAPDGTELELLPLPYA
jgi:folate-binding protein YgfZ